MFKNSFNQVQKITASSTLCFGCSKKFSYYPLNTANSPATAESSATPFSVFQNHNGVVANFLVSAYMRGVPFLTSGQEVDFNQTIPWPYTSVKINWSNTAASADFTKVLTFRNSSTAIRRGAMANYSDANVCAFTKISGTEKVLVMTNLRSGSQNYVIPASLAGSYKDAYTGASVTLTSLSLIEEYKTAT